MGLICAGKTDKRAVVINGEIKIQEMITTTLTFDHRYGDIMTFLPL